MTARGFASPPFAGIAFSGVVVEVDFDGVDPAGELEAHTLEEIARRTRAARPN